MDLHIRFIYLFGLIYDLSTQHSPFVNSLQSIAVLTSLMEPICLRIFSKSTHGSEAYFKDGKLNNIYCTYCLFLFLPFYLDNIVGVLPKYFSSEWSFAQFHLPENTKFIVAFGSQNTVVIAGMNGRYVCLSSSYCYCGLVSYMYSTPRFFFPF